MSLLRLRGVHRYYGAEHILGPLDLEVHQADRIGLIGPNGSGKSTLLDILAGKEPDEGEVFRTRGIRIGYLRQEVPGGDELTLLDYALSAFEYLDEVEEGLKALEVKMADPAVQSDAEALQATVSHYQRLMTQLEQEGGLQKEPRARAVLFGLGFAPEELDKPVGRLSGGQRARAQLARVLLGAPDVLLLDEPTNHLDLEAVQWLESFLARYPKAVVLVSHDRYLLQAVATKIWEIEGDSVVVYNAGYEASRRQAAERLERMAKLYEVDQKERERLEAFIRKYKAGSRSTQAKSREKRLEKLPEVAPPPLKTRKARFTVPLVRRSERRVCTLENVTLGYGPIPVLSGVDLEIVRGQRIGIAGPNGSGKSTLLRAIAGEIEPLQGRIDMGRGVVVAYYSQTRTDLAPDETVLEAALGAKHQLVEEARKFLARFLFRGDDVFKQVGTLSGGEKSRLALARLLLSGGNLLILDEPTNHLDIDMREALEEALEAYEGTLLFVTHDRKLLDALADIVWWVDDGKLHTFEDGYQQLVGWLAERKTAAGDDEGMASGGAGDGAIAEAISGASGRGTSHRRAGKGDAGGARAGGDERRARALQRERERRLALVEAEVERLSALKAQLEEALAAPETYEDPERAAELGRQHAQVAAELQEQEALWLELAEEGEGEL